MKPKLYAVILTSLFLYQSTKCMEPSAAAAADEAVVATLTDAEVTETLTLLEIECTRKVQEKINTLARATQQAGLTLMQLVHRYQKNRASTIGTVTVKHMIIFLFYRDTPITFNHELFDNICNGADIDLIEALFHNIDPTMNQEHAKQIVAWLSLQNRSKRIDDVYLNEILLLLEIKTRRAQNIKIDRRSSLLLYAAAKGVPEQILPIYKKDPHALAKQCRIQENPLLYNKTPLDTGEDLFHLAMVTTAQDDLTHPCYTMRYIRTCLELRKAKVLYDQLQDAVLNEALEESIETVAQQRAEKKLSDQRLEALLNNVAEKFFTEQLTQTQRQQEHTERQQAEQAAAAARKTEKELVINRKKNDLETWKQSITRLLETKQVEPIRQKIKELRQQERAFNEKDIKDMYLDTITWASRESDQLDAEKKELEQRAADATKTEKERIEQEAINAENKRRAEIARVREERKKAAQAAPVQPEREPNAQPTETAETAQPAARNPQHPQQNPAAPASALFMPRPRSTTTGQPATQQNHVAPNLPVPPVPIEGKPVKAPSPVDWARLVEEQRQIVEAQQRAEAERKQQAEAAEVERKRQAEEAQRIQQEAEKQRREQAEAEEEGQISEEMKRLSVGRPRPTLASVANVETLQRKLAAQRDAIRKSLRAKNAQ